MSHTTQAKREAQAADETEAHPCQLDAVERRIEEDARGMGRPHRMTL
jgi:hypothetical protein